MEKIPCSVCILTHNSSATLARALESVRDFDEIIVCDGRSTDDTLAIAARYGARVLTQDAAFLNAEGRLQNYSGVRNQYLHAAKYDWVLALDSDELITPALSEEIRLVCATEPAAYWVPRKYEFRGKVIERALNYPSRQMRFFHRAAVTEYTKPIHERITVRPGAAIKTLSEYMIIPVDDDPQVGKEKWKRYIALERARRSGISFRVWVQKSMHECAVMGLFALRLVRVLALQRGNRFPLAMEIRIFWYQWSLITMLFSKIDRF